MTDLWQRYDWQVLERHAASPVRIDDNATLAEHAERWLKQPLLALDTEFMRTDTFYPIPGLIQIADEHGCYLIDPLSVSDMTPLVRVLAAPEVLKVTRRLDKPKPQSSNISSIAGTTLLRFNKGSPMPIITTLVTGLIPVFNGTLTSLKKWIGKAN